MFLDFPKAIPDPRGCGERKAGGIYAESGLGISGRPIEHFLIDPPQPLPEGLDLVNKPQLWMRCDPASGEPMLDQDTEQPIYDLLIWVGAEHYPEVPGYVEETRRLGASRRLNPQMDLSKLTRCSHMIFAHPRAIIASWREITPPKLCQKRLPFHDQTFYEGMYSVGTGETLDVTHDDERIGPCIYKLWEVLPQDEAVGTFEQEGGQKLSLRTIGSTIYYYAPTGEEVREWQPGLFMALPLTGIALIEYNDGSIDEKAKQKLITGMEQNKNVALPFYETDR